MGARGGRFLSVCGGVFDESFSSSHLSPSHRLLRPLSTRFKRVVSDWSGRERRALDRYDTRGCELRVHVWLVLCAVCVIVRHVHQWPRHLTLLCQYPTIRRGLRHRPSRHSRWSRPLQPKGLIRWPQSRAGRRCATRCCKVRLAVVSPPFVFRITLPPRRTSHNARHCRFGLPAAAVIGRPEHVVVEEYLRRGGFR